MMLHIIVLLHTSIRHYALAVLALIFYHHIIPAEDLHARAKAHFVEADLQRNCSWNNMFQRLLQYKEDNGDTLVLTSKDSPADVKKLAKWVQNQRVHYKYFMNGDKKHIKEYRVDALNRVRPM